MPKTRSDQPHTLIKLDKKQPIVSPATEKRKQGGQNGHGLGNAELDCAEAHKLKNIDERQVNAGYERVVTNVFCDVQLHNAVNSELFLLFVNSIHKKTAVRKLKAVRRLKMKNVWSIIALILVIIGGLNWMVVGIFNFNVVDWYLRWCLGLRPSCIFSWDLPQFT